MKTIRNHFNITLTGKNVLKDYFGSMRPCVYDIETTGLNCHGNNGKVILTALLVPEDDGLSVTQFFAEGPFEEAAVLMNTMKFLTANNIDYLITYNGDRFDIPFTKTRLERLNMPSSLDMYVFDMYRLLKRTTLLPDILDAMSQKNIEEHMGLSANRSDKITGRESAALYHEYVRSKNKQLEDIILTHNLDDVLQLFRIFDLLSEEYFGSIAKPEYVNSHAAAAAFSFPLHLRNLKPREQKNTLDCTSKFTGILSVKPHLSQSKLKITGRQFSCAPSICSSSLYSIKKKKSCDGVKKSHLPVDIAVFPDTENDISAIFSSITSAYEISVPAESFRDSLYVKISSLLKSQDSRLSDILAASESQIGDYLILSNGSKKNHRDINIFSKLLIEHVFYSL